MAAANNNIAANNGNAFIMDLLRAAKGDISKQAKSDTVDSYQSLYKSVDSGIDQSKYFVSHPS